MAAQYYHEQPPPLSHPSQYQAPPPSYQYGQIDQHQRLPSSVSSMHSTPPPRFINNGQQPPQSPPIQSPPAQPSQSYRQYLATLPMFPLSTIHEAQAKQAKIDQANEIMKRYIPKPKLTISQRLVMGYMDVMGGGGSISSARHIENGLTVANAWAKNLHAEELATIVLTRWALLDPDPTLASESSGELILIDVLEYRWKAKCTPVYLKHSSGRPVKLELLGKSNVKVKAGGVWKKSSNFAHVEELGIINGSGQGQPMEIIRRDQRGISASEWHEMEQRFEFGWHVPVMRA